MARKGVTKEKIIEAAKELIYEKGYKNFSVRELADRLDIKASSLYKHIDNIDEIRIEIGLNAIRELIQVQNEAIANKPREEALLALANSFRKLALQKPEDFKIIMALPEFKDERIRSMTLSLIEPIMAVLNRYQISQEQKMHWQRILRSTMYGFIAYELTAYYFIAFPVDVNESYRMAILNIAAALESLERECLSRVAYFNLKM